MNSYAMFELAHRPVESFIETVNNPSELNDEENLLAELDKEKKYNLYGVEIGEIEQHFKKGRVELGVSEKLFQVRVHEYCTMSAIIEPYGINMFANPNWDNTIFMPPGADAIVMSVLDLSKSTDYRLLFAELTPDGQIDTEKDLVTVSLKKTLEEAMRMVYEDGENDINIGLEAQLLVFDDYRVKTDYERNGDTLRIFVNYHHIPYNDGAETKYGDFLIIFYKYTTRLK